MSKLKMRKSSKVHDLMLRQRCSQGTHAATHAAMQPGDARRGAAVLA